MSLPKSQIIFMSAATGLIAANLYYCQPLILLIAKEFSIPEGKAGTIAYLTQAGYAIGLFFMVPIGDKVERKKQILITTIAAVATLILAATAQKFFILQLASLLIGITSIVPQLILPLAATLSEPEERGKVVGIVMSGLLIGILLSRTVSGLVGEYLGWRSMYWIAAAICFVIFGCIKKIFPVSIPEFSGTYAHLIRSLVTLIKTQPVLREATLINSLAFAQFGAFWTTMVLFLSSEPFYYNTATIGMFGIVGASGALAAPLVGKFGDKGNPRAAIGYGCGLMLVAFIVFYFSTASIYGVLIGILLLDVGLQCVHISNQTRVYAILPQARNRLNTVYMSFSFFGTAIGSAVGLLLWNIGKWEMVSIGGALTALASVIIYGLTYKRKTG